MKEARVMKEAVLSLQGLSVSRGSQLILDQVDFDLQHGEFVALLGPNGVGKSTFIDCASAELVQDRGQVLLDGRHLQSVPLAERAKILAVLPQQSTLQFPFLVEEVIALGRFPHRSGAEQDKLIVNAVSEALAVDHLLLTAR